LSNNKKAISILILILSLIMSAYSLFASNDDVHNRQMLQVLFGKSSILKAYDQRLFYVDGFMGEKKESILALQKAMYWCVDEFNGDSRGYPRQYLSDLVRFGVTDVPPFDLVDFTAGSEHQKYTHKGWDFVDYPVNHNDYYFKEIWRRRKNLLLSTIDRIFDFQPNEMIKRDSYIISIYWVIILEIVKIH